MSPSLTPRQRGATPRGSVATFKPPLEPADPMESMIQAAHQHLADAGTHYSHPQSESQQRRLRTNQEHSAGAPTPPSRVTAIDFQLDSESSTGVEKLSEHMESFPLVPLAVIPQLALGDLEKLESGLAELLRSLSAGDNERQLGEYATRQLTLVQRQLSQQRAEQRVLQLLRGDLSVALGPIKQCTSLNKSSSATAVPIFLTPRRSPLTSAPASKSSAGLNLSRTNVRASSVSLPSMALSPSGGSHGMTVKQHWRSKKAAVLMARKQVRVNQINKTPTTSSVPVSGFIIASGDGGNKRRRRPRPTAKVTEEEEAQRRLHKLERDRERRRQAAYQRLQARQELQAKRRQDQQRVLNSRKAQHFEIEQATGASSRRRQHKSNDSECEDTSESEASDVSNCSESDEANERAILALEIQITASHENEVDGLCSESESSMDDAAAGEVGDIAVQEEAFVSHDEQAEGLGEHSVDELVPEINLHSATASTATRQSTRQSNPEASLHPTARVSSPTEARLKKSEHVDQFDEAEQPLLANNDRAKSEFLAEQQQREQKQEIVHDLQLFMASRTAAMLGKLQTEKDARGWKSARDSINSARPVESLHSNTTPTRTQSSFRRSEVPSYDESGDHDTAEPTKAAEVVQDCEPAAGNDSEQSNTATTTLVAKDEACAWTRHEEEEGISGKTLRMSTNTVGLPRVPVAECKDYSSYFSNFHCILTSVFEQSHRTANTCGTSSSSSLYHRPVGAGGDHTMCLQLKLYQSWKSIMQDYATVFGPRITAPEGMVPVAAATPWTPHYRVNSTTRREVCEIVAGALGSMGGGWEEHPSGLGLKTTWNLLWTWSKPRVERQTLLVWQKVNHFQHAKALTRKDCLKKHIGKYLAAGGRLRQAFDIIPPTFLLPKEYVAFVQAFQARGEALRKRGMDPSKNVWIMKPVALSRGRGISLVNDLSQVVYGEQVVVQEYIAAPRLLDGFKFDLRLYVLVTSFNPLEAFLYDEGFVRLCTRPYHDGDISNLFVHLTNSSIQKVNQGAIAGTDNPVASASTKPKAGANPIDTESKRVSQAEVGGTKTTLAYLWRRLEAEGVDVDKVKRSIEEVVLKALLCGEDHIPFQVNSFDLLGYDILLDAELRPWLIEINSSPSMARDHDLDFQVKDAMMLDTLRVVDPLPFDRAKLAEVIARRIYDLESEKRRSHVRSRHPREAEELATRQLNEDLTAILRGRVPRAYGELPENLGSYTRLCPHTTPYNQLLKLKRSCLRPTERRA